MWSRRATIDKEHLQVKDDRGVAISRACGGLEKSIYSHELEVDPTGFAFGGLKTEKVRVRGRGYGNWETRTIHRVYYSIGLAGSYLLHVRLRREGLPVPGSPFQLNVVPGVAVAHASFLTTEAEPIGTRKLGILLQTCDVMGNACVAGGADVTCSSPGPEDLRCVVRDNRDGTYKLEWRASRRFCAIEVRVGGLHVVGSPLMFGGEDVSPTNSPPVSSRSQEPNLHTSRRMDIGLGGFRLPAMAAYVPAALDEDPFEYLRDDDEAAAAATMIGARVRGQQGRKRSQAKAAIASIPTDPEAQKAASKVQAMQRGKNTRKKQQKKKAAAAAAAVPLPAEADRPQTPKRLKPQAKRAVAVAAPIQRAKGGGGVRTAGARARAGATQCDRELLRDPCRQGEGLPQPSATACSGSQGVVGDARCVSQSSTAASWRAGDGVWPVGRKINRLLIHVRYDHVSKLERSRVETRRRGRSEQQNGQQPGNSGLPLAAQGATIAVQCRFGRANGRARRDAP